MSALTRLLEELPREFYDDGRMAQASKVLLGIGAGMLGMGGVLGIVATATGEPGVFAGMIGPTAAGLVNLVLGVAFRHRSEAAGKINLTADARQLLGALVLERLPQRPGPGSYSHRYNWQNNARPLVVVPAPLEEKLEAFAGAYLDLKTAAQGSSVHGVRAKAAAVDALVEGLNAAAAAIRHPDGEETSKLQRLTEGMKEAAQRLDPSDTAPPTLDALLTDLREEERARQELMG